MQLTIIGTGYVGLVTGTCFAETGNNVVCVDINQEKIDQLKAGKTPIYEPGLENLLERNIKEKRIQFTTSIEEGVKDAQIIFLALPTPPGKDGAADLQFVLDVAAKLSGLITRLRADGIRIVTVQEIADIHKVPEFHAPIIAAGLSLVLALYALRKYRRYFHRIL